MKRTSRNYQRFVYPLVGLAMVVAIWRSLLPPAVEVEVATVDYRPIRVSIHEDGRTRVKEKYVVSAPLAGRLARVQLHAGDAVVGNETILTELYPAPPSLLDARARAEATARVQAAAAAEQQAAPALEKARVAAQFANEEFIRAQQLRKSQSISHEDLDRAELHARQTAAAEQEAEFSLLIAQHELTWARAALIHTNSDLSPAETSEATPTTAQDISVPIRSPISGQVLRIFQESAAIVTPNTPLMLIGNVAELEVVADVLSSDAVQISPGDPVLIDRWGGNEPLRGQVRLVEPAGFTKISALGVEEQRVNVIIDFLETGRLDRRLGDDFRVETEIILEQLDRALTIPTPALFHQGNHRAVFVVSSGRCEIRAVECGRQTPTFTEVLQGVRAGDVVVIYPSDKVVDAARVQVTE